MTAVQQGKLYNVWRVGLLSCPIFLYGEVDLVGFQVSRYLIKYALMPCSWDIMEPVTYFVGFGTAGMKVFISI
jgi:hypothetical protein